MTEKALIKKISSCGDCPNIDSTHHLVFYGWNRDNEWFCRINNLTIPGDPYEIPIPPFCPLPNYDPLGGWHDAEKDPPKTSAPVLIWPLPPNGEPVAWARIWLDDELPLNEFVKKGDWYCEDLTRDGFYWNITPPKFWRPIPVPPEVKR